MGKFIEATQEQTTMAKNIVARVQEHAKVRNIFLKTRNRNICDARRVAFYLMWRDLGMSPSVISRMFLWPRPTVLFSILKIPELYIYDPQFHRLWKPLIEPTEA